jgi:hypothetical protein
MTLHYAYVGTSLCLSARHDMNNPELQVVIAPGQFNPLARLALDAFAHFPCRPGFALDRSARQRKGNGIPVRGALL